MLKKTINPIEVVKKQISQAILNAYSKAVENNELVQCDCLCEVELEIPKESGFGDFATNFSMKNAKNLRSAPIKIANAIVKYIDFSDTYIERAEAVNPGFINFFVKNNYYGFVLNTIFSHSDSYGKTQTENPQNIMVEFVSANPTGPMHMGNARGGALGDCLAEILLWCGNDVTREFYANDAGNQIMKYFHSLKARYYALALNDENYPFPEDGYQGDDVKEHAKAYFEKYGDKYLNVDDDTFFNELLMPAIRANMARIKTDLETYRINYDVWFNESTLHESNQVKEVVALLEKSGYTYESDGALWLKSTEFGLEKDDVLMRANGIFTYFAADIAYHYNKFITRGFDRVIDVWGADHHGHVARLKGAMSALGIDSERLDIILMQLVRLVSEGKPVKMSKRTGKAITLADLLAETSVDAARFFFNMRAPDSHFDFDLDLAVAESSQNPVYYVQYAHARICSIIRLLNSEDKKLESIENIDTSLLCAQEEKELITILSQLPQIICNAARDYNPALLTGYAADIASAFHKFYNACRVNCDDQKLLQARLLLCVCTAQVLRNTLTILKISAPEKM
ncbi:MAG: arginine--tRNA ligase [Ruminococcaceae bacterium]|nr:arginine--tRNA ligase [Oscillospiraceae bacterium]